MENNFIPAISSMFPTVNQQPKKYINADEKIEYVYYDFNRIANLLYKQDTSLNKHDISTGTTPGRRRTLSGMH